MLIDLPLPRLHTASRSAGLARPQHPGLIDQHGRIADDLRISLTQKCNLRCTYCMPAQGLPTQPDNELMTRAEITRLTSIAVHQLGVRSIRLTGGEPLLRADLVEIVAAIVSVGAGTDVSLTTNGVGLAGRAQALRDAGLNRINISLDTLDEHRAAQLTRRPFLPRVLEGIAASIAAGFDPVKINAVLMPGINDGDDAVELTSWCLDRGLELRFIEQMPLDADHRWERSQLVTAADVRQRLSAKFELRPHSARRDGAPAELYDAYDIASGSLRGTIGIIASVTESFCSDCRRTRLTADGRVRSCLFSAQESDLLALVRAGRTDHDVAEAWRSAMWAKPAGHGMSDPQFVSPSRSMSQIGG